MITFYEADGLDLRVSPVVFDPGSSITTLIGAVVEAHAKIFGDVVLVGTGTVLSAPRRPCRSRPRHVRRLSLRDRRRPPPFWDYIHPCRWL